MRAEQLRPKLSGRIPGAVLATLTPAERELSDWRRKMQPAMLSALVALSLFFAIVSVWQAIAIQRDITTSDAPVAVSVLDSSVARLARVAGVASLPANELAARIALEQQVLTLRYQHANTILASRAWVRLMGFVTGMVLALAGAFFVLGRLESSSATKLSGEGGGAKGALETSMPGLVLATLGTTLMLAAILVRIDINVRDGASYLTGGVEVSATGADAASDSATPGRTATKGSAVYDSIRRATSAPPRNP